MVIMEPYKKFNPINLFGLIGLIIPDLNRLPNLDQPSLYTPPGLVFTKIPETEEKSFFKVLTNIFLNYTFAIPTIKNKFKISPVMKKILILLTNNAYIFFYLIPF